MRLMMFSKHLEPLSIVEAGRAIKGIGFDGVDLTTRPGGHVAPEQVGSALPQAVNTLAGLGLAVPLITTAITAADDPYAVDIFDAAAAAGVKEIKLGYWRYDRFGTFRTAMDEISCKLDKIEELALRTGVRANIHTHSAAFMSALAPIVWYWIKDRDPAAIGAYVDPGHMTLEGGVEGWRMGLDLLAERITLVAIKDFAWVSEEDPSLGTWRWSEQKVPLVQGIVRWPEVFTCLRQIGFDGWLSVHSEYQGSRSWRDLTVPELIEQTRQDVTYLRQVIEQQDPETQSA